MAHHAKKLHQFSLAVFQLLCKQTNWSTERYW